MCRVPIPLENARFKPSSTFWQRAAMLSGVTLSFSYLAVAGLEAQGTMTF